MYEFEFICSRFYREIIQEKYNGDISRCAVDLHLSEEHFKKILCRKTTPGIKTLKSIIMYCSHNNIDFKRYVKITEGENK